MKPVQIANLGGGNPNDNRNALLSSIQKGTKLKKTVTVDKSGPMIAGKVSGSASPAPSFSSPSRAGSSTQNTSPPKGMGGALNFQDELANRLMRSNNTSNNSINKIEDRPREVNRFL